MGCSPTDSGQMIDQSVRQSIIDQLEKAKLYYSKIHVKNGKITFANPEQLAKVKETIILFIQFIGQESYQNNPQIAQVVDDIIDLHDIINQELTDPQPSLLTEIKKRIITEQQNKTTNSNFALTKLKKIQDQIKQKEELTNFSKKIEVNMNKKKTKVDPMKQIQRKVDQQFITMKQSINEPEISALKMKIQQQIKIQNEVTQNLLQLVDNLALTNETLKLSQNADQSKNNEENDIQDDEL